MVYLKVTDGLETRKFQVTPGELTFDQLQEQVTSVFPSSIRDGASLSLQYRDTDGDVITLSSNQELQEALSDLPSGSVWKLHIRKSNPGKPYRSTPTSCQARSSCSQHRRSLFDHLFQSTRTPFGSFWENFDQHLQETEALVEQLWGLHKAHSDGETSSKPEGGENKEGNAGEPKQAEESDVTKADTKETDSQDEIVKSKLTDDTSSDSHPTTARPGSRCRSKTVVSWEPRLHPTLFGLQTVLRPVRYNVVWWEPESEKAPQDKESEKPPQDKESERPPQDKESKGTEKTQTTTSNEA